jgi:hypothetical protein
MTTMTWRPPVIHLICAAVGFILVEMSDVRLLVV